LSDLAVLETDDVIAAREEVKSVSDENSSLVSESSANRFVEQVFSDVSIDLHEEQGQLSIVKSEKRGGLTADRGSSRRTISALK